MFSSSYAVSQMRTLPSGDRIAELFLDRWVPDWRPRVAALTAPDPAKISRDTALAIILELEDTKRFVQGRQSHDPVVGSGPEQIAGWWTDAKRWLSRTAKDAWDTFTDTMKDAWDNLGDWNSLQDILDNAQFIFTSGGSALGKGASRAAEQALNESLRPFLKLIGETMGSWYGEGKHQTMKAVREAVKKATNSKITGGIAAELAGTVYDLALGYPPCICEEACIKPVSDGLKKAGGIPAIIGNVLGVIYPIIQLPQAPDASQALGLYANRLPLLPNAKISESGIVGDILDVISDEIDQTIVTPKSFARYQPWLVDYVARGLPGPTTLIDQTKTARWYYEHPEYAVDIVAQANKIDNILSGMFEWLGKIERYAKLAVQAYKTGKQIYDGAKAVELSSFGQSLSAAANDLFDTETLEKIGGWALDKARPIAERQLHQGVRMAIKELGIQKYLDQADLIAYYAGRYVPPRSAGDGNISGPNVATSFMTQWMPATIGLQARAKYSAMVELWAMSDLTERERWKSAPTHYWAKYATDFPAWHKLFNNSAKVTEYSFQLAGPTNYHAMAVAGDPAWPLLNDSVRQAMRNGDYPTLFFRNFAGRLRIPKKPKPPNVRDAGWPIGFDRPEGFSAYPSQYYAWRQDVLDIINPERFKAAYKRIESLWLAMPVPFRNAWLKDTPNGPKNPPLLLEPEYVAEALKTHPSLRLTGTNFMTRKRFWSIVMLAAHPNSLRVPDTQALKIMTEKTGAITKALLGLPPKTVSVSAGLSRTPVLELIPGFVTEPDMGKEITGPKAPKSFPIVPLALSGAGLILIGLAQKR